MSRNDPDPNGVAYDHREDEEPSESVFSFPGISWGWVPSLERGKPPELDEEREEGPPYEEETPGEDRGWLDLGRTELLLVAGVVLFLVPEPITSTLGVVLIVVGVLSWAGDALR